jgi:hypothetical protein
MMETDTSHKSMGGRPVRGKMFEEVGLALPV